MDRHTATEYIVTAIESGDATRDEFDIDAIADAAYDAAGGTWDITNLDTAIFWGLVQEHAL